MTASNSVVSICRKKVNPLTQNSEGGSSFKEIEGIGISFAAEEMEMEIAQSSGRHRLVGESQTSSAVLGVLLAASIIFFLLRKTKKEEDRPLPPGPRGVPLLGSLPFLESDLHSYFAKLADTYGPIISLRLGSKLCVVLSSSEAVREALREKDAIFANHTVPETARAFPWFHKDIVFAPHGPYWRMIRKVTVSELLSPSTLNGLYSLRRNRVQMMVDEIRAKAGQLVNIRELAAATAINTMMAMLWGGSADGSDEERKSWEGEFQLMLEGLSDLLGATNISDFFPAISCLDLQGLARRMRRMAVRFDRFFDPLIEKRLSARVDKEGKRDFLQVLLDLVKNPNAKERMTLDTVKALLLDLMSGGTDTTSTTVEWAMAELLYDTKRMARVKEEITAVVPIGNTVEEAHLPSLRYLNAVVKETLRLHPVLPLLVPHRPSSSCTLGGYRIPEDTQIFVNAWAIHRDDRLWEDASKFKPERFLEAGREDDFRYLPFGAGRRICAGFSLGERMVTFMLASMVHSADWALPEGSDAARDLKEKFGIVSRKEKALVAVPFLR